MEVADEITQVTKQLVSFRSTADRIDEIASCIAYIKGYFADTRVRVREFNFEGQPSLFISFDGRRRQGFIINGHIDVVEGFETQFRPYEKAGMLYGRGTYDMKCAVATGMVLMKQLSRKRRPPRVALMVVSDEETGGHHGTKRIVQRGYTADMVLAGEPTRMQLETRHKGCLFVKVTAYGSSGHSARPWRGTNAIEKLLRQYARLRAELPQASRKEKWAPSVNPTSFISESPMNVTPSKAEMLLDIRTNEEYTNRKVLALLRKLKIAYKILDQGGMLYNKKAGNTLIKSLRKIAASELGRRVKYIKSAGGSDMRYFSERGVTALNFSMLGGNHHKHNEYVELASIGPYYRILEKFTERNF